jgi:very-short-patch-repair endonuclease
MTTEYIINFARQVQEIYECRVIIDKEKEPYCLFCASDIGKILKIKNINDALSHFDKDDKHIIKINTNGGMQKLKFITFEGFKKLLVKSRKPMVIDFCHKLNLDINTRVYSCIEADTLKCIMDSFQGEEMLNQHNIKSYLIDLYFPKYKLIIECDEDHHKIKRNIENDILRENEIKKTIPDCVFIRYDPNAKDFNIFKVINKIYKTFAIV